MSKYIRSFENHRLSSIEDRAIDKFINEGWLDDQMKTASAAIKGYLGQITAPFKSVIKDIRKGMDNEKIKTSLSNSLDNAFKNANKSVDAIKDEADLAKIVPDFQGVVSQLAQQLEKEIATVKESKLFEANAQDSLIGAKVILNMVTDKMTKLKQNFDQQVAKAKDLATKKAAVKKELNNMYTQLQNDIKSIDIDALVKEYKEKNKIEGNKNGIILDWGDVEITLQSMEGETNPSGQKFEIGYYKVVKTGSKKILENDVVKITGIVKKGDKAKFTEVLRGNKPFKIDNKDFYETGNIERLVVDDKEVTEHNFGGENQDPNSDLKSKLAKIKGDADKMDVVNNLVDNLDNPDKMKQVAEILDKG
jgi:hypothetical protein